MENNVFNVADGVKKAIDKSKKLQEGIILAKWDEIVGKMSKESKPIYLKDGILRINVRSPLFHLEFKNRKQKYIELINNFFNKIVVNDLDIKLGKIDEEIIKDEREEIIKENKKQKEKISDTKAMGIMERVAQLRELSEERDKYLLNNGYRKCQICGMIYKPDIDTPYCAVCLNEKKYRKNKEYPNESD